MGVIFNKPEFTRAVCDRAHAIVNIEFDISICSVANGKLLGGVVYSNYTGHGGSVLCHMAGWSPRWMTRDLLWVGFDYPFNALQVRKIFACIPSDNRDAIAINKRWGFRDECILRDVYPGADMIVLSMQREDCRFLGLKPHAQRVAEEV
jgi:RimJ/RimL family protein N-acetyltransferase